MITIDIRSYLFVPLRDDRYHHPLVTMQKQKEIIVRKYNKFRI